MKETRTERNSAFAVIAITVVCALAFLLRLGDGRIPPFDDAYHLKRIAFSASHFPHALTFDPDRGERGEFCPWPPLYDLTMAVLGPRSSVLGFVPPVFFALFCGAVTFALIRFGLAAGWIAGVTLAISPYLIGASRAGHIDHHYVEPLLLLLIVLFASQRRGIALGIAIGVALLVQTALLVAAGVAFVALFFFDDAREGAKAFAIAAAIIIVYRLTCPDGYPNNPWFLGWPHATLLIAAAVACALVAFTSRPLALAAGVAIALTMPQSLAGLRFFGGDPWLKTILEFQPMFRNTAFIGTDVANLTGGALLAPLLWRKHRTFALFSIVYLLLALSSRRFLVAGIALFVVGGALWAAERRARAVAATLLVVLPPLIYDIATFRIGEPTHDEYRAIAMRVRPLPRGRVLAPWSFGHAIDVIGGQPVVIDNFGSMPDERVFRNAIEAMLSIRQNQLLTYCRERGVRYLVLPHPAYVPATAATIGIDPELYSRTRLGRSTVWSRLYGGERIDGFTLVSGGAISIWKVD